MKLNKNTLDPRRLPPILRTCQVQALTGESRPTVYKKAQAGIYPALPKEEKCNYQFPRDPLLRALGIG